MTIFSKTGILSSLYPTKLAEFSQKIKSIPIFATKDTDPMKNVITLLLLTISLCCAASNKPIYPASFAHRGCWFKDNVPENSLHAVRMAKRFGYKGIECDVKYTADSVMIILHDKSLNRTLRNAADYSMIKEKTYVKDLTFEELRRDYVMASDIPDMREKVPTLEELLLECKKEDIIPMLHSNIIESFELAQKIMGDGNWIAFSGKHEIMKKARNITNGLILQSIHMLPRYIFQFHKAGFQLFS